jgi:hypothetical protein
VSSGDLKIVEFDFSVLYGLISGVNLSTKAPNFTRENAGEMARRATRSRLARIERERAEAQAVKDALASRPEPEDARKERTLKQLDKLDVLIDRALNLGQAGQFLKLSSAKQRLWKLVQPTAGVLKPARERASRRGGVAIPLGDAPQAPAPDTTTAA